MNLFYHPNAVVGSTIILDTDEGIHLSKVLRKKDGDEIELTDGKGKLFKAQIESGKKEVKVLIFSCEEFIPRKQNLELAISPTKNQDRMEWLVEKSVELGIEKISFILCSHSERPHLKMDRLERIAVAAMKQSLKFFKPEISPMIPFPDWIRTSKNEHKCIAHCRPDLSRALLKDVISPGQNVAIAIGPEGDFSYEEIELATKNGFIGVSLGDSRLRTETAALASVFTFDLINQVKKLVE